MTKTLSTLVNLVLKWDPRTQWGKDLKRILKAPAPIIDLLDGGVDIISPDLSDREEGVAFLTTLQLDGDLMLFIHPNALRSATFRQDLNRHLEQVNSVTADLDYARQQLRHSFVLLISMLFCFPGFDSALKALLYEKSFWVLLAKSQELRLSMVAMLIALIGKLIGRRVFPQIVVGAFRYLKGHVVLGAPEKKPAELPDFHK